MRAIDFAGVCMLLAITSAAGAASDAARVSEASGPAGTRVVEPRDNLSPGDVTRILEAPAAATAGTKTRSIRKVAADEQPPFAALALRIQFERDSADIPQQARPQLDAVAKGIGALAGAPHIQVRGHTDSSGQQAYNDGLSARRAAAVREYLIEHGVSPQWLDAQGAGSREPLDAAAATAAVNRRVEFRRINP
jgi:outer membrane protein OmpA-like peptidoglycan-associated protein